MPKVTTTWTAEAVEHDEDPGAQAKPSLLDQLLAERSQIARDAKARVAKLDRHINLLRQSGAEEILREAQDALRS